LMSYRVKNPRSAGEERFFGPSFSNGESEKAFA
jgi:hypothetical protein